MNELEKQRAACVITFGFLPILERNLHLLAVCVDGEDRDQLIQAAKEISDKSKEFARNLASCRTAAEFLMLRTEIETTTNNKTMVWLTGSVIQYYPPMHREAIRDALSKIDVYP